MAKLYAYQIYYNEATRQALDTGFIPLDNRSNMRPDWYEFWVIRNFLLSNALDPEGWYGFFSPRFTAKTGVTAPHVQHLADTLEAGKADVGLIASEWAHIAYFLNLFEQGDYCHPGLMTLTQSFLDHIGYGTQLSQLVSHTQNFTFSNYVITKPVYWKHWLELANAFFDVVENPHHPLAKPLGQTTIYSGSHAPMKTFIQERFVALLIDKHQFRTGVSENIQTFGIGINAFKETPYTRGLLQTCNRLKIAYTTTQNAQFLQNYARVRQLIELKQWVFPLRHTQPPTDGRSSPNPHAVSA